MSSGPSVSASGSNNHGWWKFRRNLTMSLSEPLGEYELEEVRVRVPDLTSLVV
jgi:hypothetical protein